MNKYIKIFFFLFIAGSLLSCDLDRLPADAIVADEAFQSVADARNWDNGLFTFFRNRQYGVFMSVQDVQADQLNASIGFGNRSGWPHAWEPFNAGDGAILNIWTAYYSAITNTNIIINSIPGLVEYLEAGEGISVADRALLNRFLGNAHFARAFYYHQLVLRWSPAYDPATAGTALGVPIVTEFDLAALPARATLREVYQFILEDIAVARTLLAGVAGTPRYTRFSIDAVNALEARVRLHMQDWSNAFTAANNLVASGRYPLETTVTGLENLWVHDRSDEVIMQVHVSHPAGELPATTGNNVIFLSKNSATNRYSPDFLPSQWVVDMFEGSSPRMVDGVVVPGDTIDIRRPVFFSNADTLEMGGTLHTYIYRVQKFRGNPAIPGSAFGGAGNQQTVTNVQAPKVFRIAEMYLIAAEAAFRAGNEDNAHTALNALRTARGLNAVTASGDALFQEIKDERFRELAFEGFRLWDLRRWGLGMERREPQNTDLLMPGPNFFTKSVPAGHHQFVWGIPTNDLMINSNLVQNPGW